MGERMRRLGAVIALVALGGAACVSSVEGRAGDRQSVVAGFYPLAEAAERVGGSRVDVTNLTPPGGEPHEIELSPDDVDAMEDAAVILYLGQGFQPGVQEVAERAEGEAIDLLEGQDLMPAVEDGGGDPHVWLDPGRMLGIIDKVEEALSRADPERSSELRENAEDYRAEIQELDSDYRAGLSKCERDVIVTSHAAFGYLAERFGIEQHAISGISPEAEPDPARLDELADLVVEEGVTTIFTESLVSPEVAEALAREAGVVTDVLNPLEGLTPEEIAAGETYASVMRTNLERLQLALGCER